MAASEHARKMRRLRREPGVRAVEGLVNSLTPRNLMELLDRDGLSVEGTLEELRDRRLRFDVLRMDPGALVPVYEEDFRRDSLPAMTSELVVQESREDIRPSWLKGEGKASDSADSSVQARDSQPVKAETAPFRAPPPSDPGRRAPRAPAETIESNVPAPPASRMWNALISLPRLVFSRQLQEAFSQSGRHFIQEERVGLDNVRRGASVPRTSEKRVNLNVPVDDGLANNARVGGFRTDRARSNRASTPTDEESLTCARWEEMARRAFLESNRGQVPTVDERTQSTLPRSSRSGDARLAEASATPSRDVLEVESSDSDSEDEREIAANGPGAAFSGVRGQDFGEGSRGLATRPVAVVKAMKEWNLSFSGSSSGEAEEFLERLAEMQRYYRLRDSVILEAIPCALSGRALQWFRSVARDASSLREFESNFRDQFVQKMDREDIYDELRGRTQAAEETVANYLTNVRCIIARFKRPPSLSKQLRIVYRNLHPDFRHFLEGKDFQSFEDLNRLGVEFEKRKELDSRYVPPPPKSKSRILAAAYEGRNTAAKASNAKEREVSAVVKKEAKKKRAKQAGQAQSVAVATNNEEAVIEARVEAVAPANSQAQRREAQQWQRANNGQAQFSSAPPAAHNVRTSFNAFQSGGRNARTSAFLGNCFLCGRQGHRASECNAPTCFACGQKGHLANACPQRSSGNPPRNRNFTGNRGNANRDDATRANLNQENPAGNGQADAATCPPTFAQKK